MAAGRLVGVARAELQPDNFVVNKLVLVPFQERVRADIEQAGIRAGRNAVESGGTLETRQHLAAFRIRLCNPSGSKRLAAIARLQPDNSLDRGNVVGPVSWLMKVLGKRLAVPGRLRVFDRCENQGHAQDIVLGDRQAGP